MNVPDIISNARKRFVCAAAMAAVFVILASGANALANTVRCVPSLSVNPSCAVAYTHIQDAVTASVPLDVIVVAPGYYNETVLVSVANIYIVGAQAGRDARQGRDDPSKESIVDASGPAIGSGAGAAFDIIEPNVVIDGFTIEGGIKGATQGNASGVYVAADFAQIFNNIIQNNAVGVYLKEAGISLQYNLFQTNNTGEAGSNLGPFYKFKGFGVVGYGAAYCRITENAFEGNWAAAMDMYAGGDTEISKNTSHGDGSFAVFLEAQLDTMSHNQGSDFGAQGTLPLPSTSPAGKSADGAIVVSGGFILQISDNSLQGGRIEGYNGIAFSTIFPPEPSEECQVSNNTIQGFTGNGMVAEVKSGPGTLVGSTISGNDVENNGNDGILIEEGDNFENMLVDNVALNNHTNDCQDNTYLLAPSLPGTAGTFNLWFNDIGIFSDPAALCAPPKGYPY